MVMRTMDGRWGPLIERLGSMDARIGIIGLGYVGLPVAIDFAKSGFTVIGVDASERRVEEVQSGVSDLVDVDPDDLIALRNAGRLTATTCYEPVSDCDAILICVPTPLLDGAPDLSPITSAATALSKVLSPDTLVVLESTTYPGTTEDLLRPLLEIGDRACGSEFLLAFSPERIDPGNPHYSFSDIPKIVGGCSPDATVAAEILYSHVVPKVVTVPTPREAEMAKLIENTFRHVNIGLVNELAVYAHELGIDIWEAIEAASTKPFGFMPFYPGPGWGGHCIPLDPAYFSYSVRQFRGHDIRFVETAHTVNSEMPRHIVERVADLLNNSSRAVRGSNILAIGVAYKAGTEDTRHSPAFKVLDGLIRRGAEVSYHDPLVPEATIAGTQQRSVALTKERVADADLVLVLSRQHDVDWDLLASGADLIFDTCNAFGRVDDNIIRL
jgi:UDP-N-acetyl-D-glucosamine dehydrogenase